MCELYRRKGETFIQFLNDLKYIWLAEQWFWMDVNKKQKATKCYFAMGIYWDNQTDNLDRTVQTKY